jgi:hypothetical protein
MLTILANLKFFVKEEKILLKLHYDPILYDIVAIKQCSLGRNFSLHMKDLITNGGVTRRFDGSEFGCATFLSAKLSLVLPDHLPSPSD